MASDLIEDLRRRLLAVDPNTAPALNAVLPQFRAAWGGRDNYTRRTDPPQLKQEQLGSSLRQGQSLEQSFVKAGLSRASGFRYLKKPAR